MKFLKYGAKTSQIFVENFAKKIAWNNSKNKFKSSKNISFKTVGGKLLIS